MCLIVDANVAAIFFKPHREALPAFDWIDTGDGCLVYGGELWDELKVIENVRRYLRAWYQAGKARLIPNEDVVGAIRKLGHEGHCASNDLHVVALARASGARLLYSHDKALHRDFKNARVINNPRGRVYTCSRHANILGHTISCGRGKRKTRP
jgi:hypothetical protein